MSENYNGFDINTEDSTRPWGGIEEQFHRDMIDTLVGDSDSQAANTAGHNHWRMKDQTGGTDQIRVHEDYVIIPSIASDSTREYVVVDTDGRLYSTTEGLINEYTELTDTPSDHTANCIPFVNPGGTDHVYNSNFKYDVPNRRLTVDDGFKITGGSGVYTLNVNVDDLNIDSSSTNRIQIGGTTVLQTSSSQVYIDGTTGIASTPLANQGLLQVRDSESETIMSVINENATGAPVLNLLRNDPGGYDSTFRIRVDMGETYMIQEGASNLVLYMNESDGTITSTGGLLHRFGPNQNLQLGVDYITVSDDVYFFNNAGIKDKGGDLGSGNQILTSAVGGGIEWQDISSLYTSDWTSNAYGLYPQNNNDVVAIGGAADTLSNGKVQISDYKDGIARLAIRNAYNTGDPKSDIYLLAGFGTASEVGQLQQSIASTMLFSTTTINLRSTQHSPILIEVDSTNVTTFDETSVRFEPDQFLAFKQWRTYDSLGGYDRSNVQLWVPAEGSGVNDTVMMIGATDSTCRSWTGNFSVIELGARGSISHKTNNSSGELILGENLYFDGANFKFMEAGATAYIQAGNGTIGAYRAATGSKDQAFDSTSIWEWTTVSGEDRLSVNNDQADYDFQISSLNETNLFYADSGKDSIGIKCEPSSMLMSLGFPSQTVHLYDSTVHTDQTAASVEQYIKIRVGASSDVYYIRAWHVNT